MKITDKQILDYLERGLRAHRRKDRFAGKVTVEVDTYKGGGVRASVRKSIRAAKRQRRGGK